MKARNILPVTWFVCLLVGGPVWAQPQPRQCPCWRFSFALLENLAELACLNDPTPICQPAPGGLEIDCAGIVVNPPPEEPQAFFFIARSDRPVGNPPGGFSCELSATFIQPALEADLTHAEAAACYRDLQRLCAQLKQRPN